MVLSLHEYSEPPVLGHTWDIADPGEPIYPDIDRPQISLEEIRDGFADIRYARPGRRGCRAKPTITPGGAMPPLIVLEHKKGCSWLTAYLARPDVQALLEAWRRSTA